MCLFQEAASFSVKRKKTGGLAQMWRLRRGRQQRDCLEEMEMMFSCSNLGSKSSLKGTQKSLPFELYFERGAWQLALKRNDCFWPP